MTVTATTMVKLLSRGASSVLLEVGSRTRAVVVVVVVVLLFHPDGCAWDWAASWGADRIRLVAFEPLQTASDALGVGVEKRLSVLVTIRTRTNSRAKC